MDSGGRTRSATCVSTGMVHERPVDRLEREREQLRPLVGSPFNYRPRMQPRVYLDFTIQ